MQNQCLAVIKNNFEKIIKNIEEFRKILDLPIDVFLKIISSDDLVVNSEKEICDFIFNYIKFRRDIKECLPSLPQENKICVSCKLNIEGSSNCKLLSTRCKHYIHQKCWIKLKLTEKSSCIGCRREKEEKNN